MECDCLGHSVWSLRKSCVRFAYNPSTPMLLSIQVKVVGVRFAFHWITFWKSWDCCATFQRQLVRIFLCSFNSIFVPLCSFGWSSFLHNCTTEDLSRCQVSPSSGWECLLSSPAFGSHSPPSSVSVITVHHLPNYSISHLWEKDGIQMQHNHNISRARGHRPI